MVNASKQLRVDNWGVFFLQRLQLFFSKTDFCDLTLQFEGNMQLKVHRLVMNACTDYFIYLEQTCPAVDENTIMMPAELQSDVIVPIVNFMYTGLLEYDPRIYEKLYRASEMMSISVLMKLLDAQRQSIMKPSKKKPAEPSVPPSWSAALPSPKKPASSKAAAQNELPATLPGRKLPIWKRQKVPAAPMPQVVSGMSFTEPRWNKDHSSSSDNAPKPTRFEWPEDELPIINPLDTSFEEFSYTSKPLLTKEEEIRSSVSLSKPSSSKSSENNDMAELCIFGDGEDSNDFSRKRKMQQHLSKVSPKRAKTSDKENKEATISLKVNSADMDHTKIVTDILRKYPDLVKKNKNIRVKFVPGKPGEKKLVSGDVKAKQESIPVPKPRKKRAIVSNEEGPWICNVCAKGGERTQEFVLYYLYRKHMTDVHNEVFDIRLCKYCGKSCPKHRLMMYHLFVRHGLKPPPSYDFPVCDRCPYIGISVPKLLQHQKRHSPADAQCQDCKLAFASEMQLVNHMRVSQHTNTNTNPSTSKYECQYCTKRSPSTLSLLSHVKVAHLKEATRDGIIGLDEELEDYEEEEESEENESEIQYEVTEAPAVTAKPSTARSDVNIISNVKVPESQPAIISQEIIQVNKTENEDLSVPGSIATSLGLVDIVVMDEDRQYVLRQSGQSGQEFMIPTEFAAGSGFSGQVITTQHGPTLQQSVLQTTGSDIASTDELVMVLTDHDYQEEHEGGSTDNSNIVVLYSHPVGGQQGQFITSQGNLLVNSETGLLEIRNGSAITTSAPSQLIVNTSNDSPIESIEMIQREIQNHSGLKSQFFEQQIKTSNSTEQTEMSQHVTTDSDENILLQAEAAVHDAEATIHQIEATVHESEAIVNRQETVDQSGHDEEDVSLNQSDENIVHITAEEYIQDEDKSGHQLETDQGDIQEQEKSDMEELNKSEIQDHNLSDTLESEQSDIHDHDQSAIQESEQSVVLQEAEHREQQGLSESIEHSQATEMADIQSENHDNSKAANEETLEDTVDHSQEIPMEIDDEIPQNLPVLKESTPANQEIVSSLESGETATPIENSEDDSFEELHLCTDENKSADITEQLPPEVQDQLPAEDVGVDVPPEIREQLRDTYEEEKDIITENETPTEHNSNEENNSSPEEHAKSPCEAMEVDGTREDILESAEDNEKHTEDSQNERPHASEIQHTDEDESNSQSSHDTKENEYNDKSQSNINQTILDDWDDTDSQQSEKLHKHKEKLETVDSLATAEAVENVNKLMDDWEEEDEEEKRDDQ